MTEQEYLNLKKGDDIHSDFDNKNGIFIKIYQFKGDDKEIVKIKKATFGVEPKIHRLSKDWVIDHYDLGKKEV